MSLSSWVFVGLLSKLLAGTAGPPVELASPLLKSICVTVCLYSLRTVLQLERLEGSKAEERDTTSLLSIALCLSFATVLSWPGAKHSRACRPEKAVPLYLQILAKVYNGMQALQAAPGQAALSEQACTGLKYGRQDLLCIL